MTQQDNIQIVRHIFEAWNEHDPDRYVKLLDEKHVVESDTLRARSPAARPGVSSCRCT
jgi:ketosteroid isomerase-like protein